MPAVHQQGGVGSEGSAVNHQRIRTERLNCNRVVGRKRSSVKTRKGVVLALASSTRTHAARRNRPSA